MGWSPLDLRACRSVAEGGRRTHGLRKEMEFEACITMDLARPCVQWASQRIVHGEHESSI